MRHTGAGHRSDIGPSAICTTGQGKAQGKLCVSGHCFSCAIFFGLSHSDIGTTAISVLQVLARGKHKGG